MGKCAIIGAECPETADRTKETFCPLWKSGIPNVVYPTGFTVFPSFTGCFLDKIDAYGIATARDAAHSAAAFNDARDKILGADNSHGQPLTDLATVGLVLLGGAVRCGRIAESSEEPAPEMQR